MRKKILVIGMALTLAVATSFYSYFQARQTSETEKLRNALRNTAQYVRGYRGKNPRLVLMYIEDNLRVIGSYLDVDFSEISKLEKKISQASLEITPENYEPILKEIGDNIEKLN